MKLGRKNDRKRTNRRQKHELAYRAKKWRCSKLAVILADKLAECSYEWGASTWVRWAQNELRRANREANR